jgi:hypothetical protein
MRPMKVTHHFSPRYGCLPENTAPLRDLHRCRRFNFRPSTHAVNTYVRCRATVFHIRPHRGCRTHPTVTTVCPPGIHTGIKARQRASFAATHAVSGVPVRLRIPARAVDAAAARLRKRMLAGADVVRGRIQIDGQRYRYKLRALALAEDGA